jgi:hypothetical protein
MDIREFQQKQHLPYEAKVAHAEVRAWEFYKKITGEYGANCHVSVGGLDSITLLCFLRSIGIDVPAVSVSILEDKGNQEVHKQLGVISIAPYMTKTKVLQELGFPVVSKAKANKINYLLTPDSEKQTFIHAIMTGDMGEQGHFQHSNKIKLPEKWIKLFGYNYREHRPDLAFTKPPEFKVSSRCCYYMKEKPAQQLPLFGAYGFRGRTEGNGTDEKRL